MILLWGLRPGALALHVPPDALTARRVGYQALPTWDPQQLDSPKPVRMKYDWRAARGAFDRERWVGRKPDVHLHVAERSLLSLVCVSLPLHTHVEREHEVILKIEFVATPLLRIISWLTS